MARLVKHLPRKLDNLSLIPGKGGEQTPESCLLGIYMCVCTHAH